jgi:hypothetical protein
MVSPLVTIREFWRFFEHSDWRSDRMDRSSNSNAQLEVDLAAVNLYDEDHLPASVTWFDALAYCHYYEQKTGLPVRLLEVEEWKQISPPPAQNIESDFKGGSKLVIINKHSNKREFIEPFRNYPSVLSDDEGRLRFGDELTWSQNTQGLKFLSVVQFGEWLADFAYGHASVANAATGKALLMGSIYRDRCPAHLTMGYKGLKVGFRLCYVAQLDS